MYCNNCGESGHVFRACPYPVISCGILFIRGTYEPLVLPTDPKSVGVLMVRRKDSMSYTEFIQGKYDVHDLGYIEKQIQNMTIDEQSLILTSSFENLWSRVWGNSRDHDFELAKQKFESVNRKDFVDNARSKFSEPEWGFPKGRRMRGESDIECAKREFFEETNIPAEAYTLRPDLEFSEMFVGTNGVKYKHVYFVATMNSSKYMNLKQKFTPNQRREISAIAWKSLSECKTIIRPHYSERKRMITELEKMVSLGSV
uniref:Nudix hydrolase domain-containing protein n=1 Tax=viral metagenome TaxID=1070528 RepID=A0A6C0JW29_9ZZZZ